MRFCSADDREGVQNFCKNLPSGILSLSGALHTAPPPLPSTTVSRAQLKSLTSDLRSIPIAIAYALATLSQDVTLPTKARMTVLDALAGILDRLFVPEQGEPLRPLELNMAKAVAKGLESSERSVRMAARHVLPISPPDMYEHC